MRVKSRGRIKRLPEAVEWREIGDETRRLRTKAREAVINWLRRHHHVTIRRIGVRRGSAFEISRILLLRPFEEGILRIGELQQPEGRHYLGLLQWRVELMGQIRQQHRIPARLQKNRPIPTIGLCSANPSDRSWRADFRCPSSTSRMAIPNLQLEEA